MISVEFLVAYYANLLILQYNTQPRARATIEAIAGLFVAQNIFLLVLNAFNMSRFSGDIQALLEETRQLEVAGINGVSEARKALIEANNLPLAEGKQLDLLGIYAGVSRNYLVGNIPKSLSDENYWKLLQVAASMNYSNFSFRDVHDTLNECFGTDAIARPFGIMSAHFLLNGSGINEDLMQSMIYHNLIPLPMGVQFAGFLYKGKPWFGLIPYGQEATVDWGENAHGFEAYGENVLGSFLTYGEE